MRGRKTWWAVAAMLGIAGLAVAIRSRTGEPGGAVRGVGGGRGAAGGPEARPIPVVVASVSRRDVPIYLEGLGSVVANRTVTVRTQVDGRLQEVRFQEGRRVRRGEVLAQIDPRPFQAQLDQAQGALLRDQSQLRAARLNVGRDRRLVAQKLVAQQQLDADTATAGQLEGAVRIDQARSRRPGSTSTTPGSPRRSTASPACASSIPATWCTPPTPAGSWSSPSSIRSPCSSRAAGRAAARSRTELAQGPLHGRGVQPRRRGPARPGDAAGDRQPDQRSDRHDPPQGDPAQPAQPAVAEPVREGAPPAGDQARGAGRARGRRAARARAARSPTSSSADAERGDAAGASRADEGDLAIVARRLNEGERVVVEGQNQLRPGARWPRARQARPERRPRPVARESAARTGTGGGNP